jgi:hypothetical protein
MYKLTVINNKFRLFGKRETTTMYETVEELLEAVDNVDDNKSYYISDENGVIIDIEELRGHKPIEPVYEKLLETEYEGIKIRILLTENKFNHEIKSRLEVSNKEDLYKNCFRDNKLFSKLELYNYFKRHLKELKDLELAYMILSLIFN